MTADILSSLVVKDGNKVAKKGVVYLKTILFNGNFVDVEKEVVGINSSVFSGIVGEDYFYSRGDVVYFWRDFYLGLVKKIESLRLNASQFPTSEALKRMIECLVSRNHYPPYSRFKILVFADDERMYWIICEERLKGNPYEMDREGVFLQPNRVPIFVDNLTSYDIVPMAVKFGDKDVENSGENVYSVRLTADRKVLNTTLGNIYYLINGELFTGDLGHIEDAIDNTLMSVITSDEKLKKVPLRRSESTTEEDLMLANACFTASAKYGIRVVRGYRDHRYLLDYSKAVAMAMENHLKY